MLSLLWMKFKYCWMTILLKHKLCLVPHLSNLLHLKWGELRHGFKFNNLAKKKVKVDSRL